MTDKRGIAITADRLTYSYGGKDGKDALSDLSFQVEKGEFFVIIGPNGSGKSTLMGLLSGVDNPKNGTLAFEGCPFTRMSRNERAKQIAFVPQTPSMAFSMTVRDLVMSGRAPRQGILGVESEDDKRAVDEAMAFTGVTEFMNRDVFTLSGGERQRVFIAAAIAQEPSLLLLDEPTSSLDPAHLIRVMDLMERLKREKNMTVIMVLHDINLTAMYSERVLVLKNGKMACQGSVIEALTLETLETVYECRFYVDQSPGLPVPRFFPKPGNVP